MKLWLKFYYCSKPPLCKFRIQLIKVKVSEQDFALSHQLQRTCREGNGNLMQFTLIA